MNLMKIDKLHNELSLSLLIEGVISITFGSIFGIVECWHIPLPVYFPTVVYAFSKVRVRYVESSETNGIAEAASYLLNAVFFIKVVVSDEQS